MSHTPVPIDSVDVMLLDLPTIRPHQLSVTTMRRQKLVLVRVRAADGVTGWGEATTIGGLAYGEESPESMRVNIVTAPGHRKLTTRINIDGDPYLWDDFAFATRDGLVPPMTRVTAPAALRASEVDAPFYSIDFDFDLHARRAGLPADQIERAHFVD